MTQTPSKIRFEQAGPYFVGLLLLALIGFWPSYFSRFFDGTADFAFYFHFHAVIAVLWIAALIIQPVLVRKKQLAVHRLVGRGSYILVPLIYISVMLLAHSRISGSEESWGLSLWIPFKDLFIFGIAYCIAIRYRHTVEIHARGMIAAGIVLIEPALVRAVGNLAADSALAPYGYLITIGLVYALLLGLIIRERHQSKGRWVFPLILGLYVFVHSVILLRIKIAPWQAFAEWFGGLPLT